jgi:hypothetical protein
MHEYDGADYTGQYHVFWDNEQSGSQQHNASHEFEVKSHAHTIYDFNPLSLPVADGLRLSNGIKKFKPFAHFLSAKNAIKIYIFILNLNLFLIYL